MNTKTSLIILGLIAASVVAFLILDPENQTIDPTIDNSDTVGEEIEVEVPEDNQYAEPEEGDEETSDPIPEDPAFPTTGFEPTN